MMNGASNPQMLRAIAYQLENTLSMKPKNEVPEYMINSTKQFVEDLKRFANELEEKQKIVTP